MSDENKKDMRRTEDFLLAEYNNIAQAHFKTMETISAFFKQYLLVVSLPLSVFALTEKVGLTIPNVAGLSLGIAVLLIGLCVFGYMVNLRLDAILYARTINGLRQYFLNKSGIEYNEEVSFRVLPRTIHQPRYLEWNYFGFVTFTFIIINASYLFAGICYCYWSTVTWYTIRGGVILFSTYLIVAVIHCIIYVCLAKNRERGYFEKPIIGVDIDGVLNSHRNQFCEILEQQTGKTITPDSIKKMPVNECDELNVSEKEERDVFNCPEYWTTMPINNNSDTCLTKIKNSFGYEVVIFTFRPWPDPKSKLNEKVINSWMEYYPWWNINRYRISNKLSGFFEKAMKWWYVPNILDRYSAIRGITRTWLKTNKIPFDKLYVEKGNMYVTEAGILDLNRFAMSAKKKIHIFVEDDLYKAIKLSRICELVFLIEHPYNKTNEALPNNIILVDNWNGIYKYLRNYM